MINDESFPLIVGYESSLIKADSIFLIWWTLPTQRVKLWHYLLQLFTLNIDPSIQRHGEQTGRNAMPEAAWPPLGLGASVRALRVCPLNTMGLIKTVNIIKKNTGLTMSWKKFSIRNRIASSESGPYDWNLYEAACWSPFCCSWWLWESTGPSSQPDHHHVQSSSPLESLDWFHPWWWWGLVRSFLQWQTPFLGLKWLGYKRENHNLTNISPGLINPSGCLFWGSTMSVANYY